MKLTLKACRSTDSSYLSKIVLMTLQIIKFSRIQPTRRPIKQSPILLQNKILRAVIIPKATALPNNQNTFFNALIQKGWHQNFFVKHYVLSNPIITDE